MCLFCFVFCRCIGWLFCSRCLKACFVLFVSCSLSLLRLRFVSVCVLCLVLFLFEDLCCLCVARALLLC